MAFVSCLLVEARDHGHRGIRFELILPRRQNEEQLLLDLAIRVRIVSQVFKRVSKLAIGKRG